MDIESIIDTVTLEEIEAAEEASNATYEGGQSDSVMLMIAFD